MTKKKSEKLAKIISHQSVDSAAKNVIALVGKLQYPYRVIGDEQDAETDINVLRVMERVFETKHKGLRLSKGNIKSWPKLFKKCECIINMARPKLSDYVQVILMETLGHRYADYYRLTRSREDDFNRCYGFAYNVSIKHGFYSHKDSSSFWNGIAYLRCGKIKKSAPFFVRVTQNRLLYKHVSMHRLKIQASFDFFVDYPEYVPNNMSQCVKALIEQNDRFFNRFRDRIPKSNMKKYKRWL